MAIIDERLNERQEREMRQREDIAQKYGVDHFAVHYWWEDMQKKGVSWGDFVDLCMSYPDEVSNG